MSRTVSRHVRALVLATGLAALFALGGGCKCTRTPPPSEAKAASPNVRLYLISSVAGALEPCGCVKDMLGGVDHLAAFVDKERANAPHALALGAGPMFFMDPELDSKKAAQDRWKAEALAHSLASLGLKAWAPGRNDWAGGGELLKQLDDKQMSLLGANLDAPGLGVEKTRVYTVGGYRVGVAGVSQPAYKNALPDGVTARDLRADLEAGLKSLEKEGAQIKVALVAAPRGEALRLAETVPGFHLMLVGKPADKGESNDPPTPAVKIGDTLVVEGRNHLQAVAVVDFFVRGEKFVFEDASRTADEERRTSLRLNLAELEGRLKLLPADSPDRKHATEELAKKRAELETLSKSSPPAEGSFMTYKLVEVREGLGTDAKAAQFMSDYYRRVNEHNREAFKDLLPKPAPEGQASYVGIEVCSSCHAEEREFWNTTGHAKAYATLDRQFKQFNLECVGCHVTGYDQPGGSTVTHVEKLKDVQCETCHGPGSRHVQSPVDKTLIQASPPKTLCAPQCHHPPHVPQGWSADAAWPKIIGKGHGM